MVFHLFVHKFVKSSKIVSFQQFFFAFRVRIFRIWSLHSLAILRYLMLNSIALEIRNARHNISAFFVSNLLMCFGYCLIRYLLNAWPFYEERLAIVLLDDSISVQIGRSCFKQHLVTVLYWIWTGFFVFSLGRIFKSIGRTRHWYIFKQYMFLTV